MTNAFEITISPIADSLTSQELEECTLDLKTEIEQSGTFGISVSETQQKNDGMLGPEWLPVLTAILSAPVAIKAIEGLIRLLQDWMRRRKPISISLKGPKGKYTLTADNMSADEMKRIAEKLI